MALDILEWGIIAVMVVSIFIYGPEKVPEIAKTLGNARRDIDAQLKQFQGITKELQTSVGTGNIDGLMGTLTGLAGGTTPADAQPAAAPAAAPAAPAGAAGPGDGSGDKLLVEMAKKLDISTRGKTRDEIQAEIVAKASKGPATPVSAVQVETAEDGTSAAAVQESAPAEAAAPATVQDEPTPPRPTS